MSVPPCRRRTRFSNRAWAASVFGSLPPCTCSTQRFSRSQPSSSACTAAMVGSMRLPAICSSSDSMEWASEPMPSRPAMRAPPLKVWISRCRFCTSFWSASLSRQLLSSVSQRSRTSLASSRKIEMMLPSSMTMVSKASASSSGGSAAGVTVSTLAAGAVVSATGAWSSAVARASPVSSPSCRSRALSSSG